MMKKLNEPSYFSRKVEVFYMLKGIIPFAHQILRDTIKEGNIVIDATCGNGNDTLFLSKLVGNSGKVFAFDIQQQAIETTRTLLAKNNCLNVELIHDSHAKINTYIDVQQPIAGAIFNLGYLPRSDKKIITKSDSTISAIESITQQMKKNAIMAIVVYHGHDGGKEEKDAVIDFTSNLDQNQFAVLTYQFINQKNNPPFVIAVQKK